jgi:hypothetical protein
MHIIVATQEAEIREIMVPSQSRQIVCKSLLKKNHHKKGLVEWVRVYALSSNHSTTKIKNYFNFILSVLVWYFLFHVL